MKKAIKPVFAAALASLTLAACGCQSISDIEGRLDGLLTDTAAPGTEAPVTIAGSFFTPEPETKPETTASPETTAAVTAAHAGTDQTPPAVSENTVREMLDPYVFAVSFTYYGVYDLPPMTNPETLWETIGWYAGYQYIVNAVGSYTDDEIKQIQRCLTGSDEYIECPDFFISDELAEHKGGKWKFGYFIEAMNEYFGGYGVFNYVSEFDGLEASGNITEEADDGEYSWLVFVTFGHDDNGYYVADARVPDGGGPDIGTPMIYEDGQEVSAEDLEIMMEQNDFSFLLKDGIKMRETETSSYAGETDSVYEVYYYYENGGLVQVAVNEGKFSSGYVGGFDLYRDGTKGRIVCSPATYFSGESKVSDEMLEKQLTRTLLFTEKWFITAEDDSTITISSGTESEDYVNQKNIVMDKGTFRIYKIVSTSRFLEDGEEVMSAEYTENYEYSADIAIPDDCAEIIKQFGGKKRKVTVVDVGDQLSNGTMTYSVPCGWELYPYDGYSYMDEGLTKPYEYPGDDVDYTIYVSFAAG